MQNTFCIKSDKKQVKALYHKYDNNRDIHQLFQVIKYSVFQNCIQYKCYCA